MKRAEDDVIFVLLSESEIRENSDLALAHLIEERLQEAYDAIKKMDAEAAARAKRPDPKNTGFPQP